MEAMKSNPREGQRFQRKFSFLHYVTATTVYPVYFQSIMWPVYYSLCLLLEWHEECNMARYQLPGLWKPECTGAGGYGLPRTDGVCHFSFCLQWHILGSLKSAFGNIYTTVIDKCYKAGPVQLIISGPITKQNTAAAMPVFLGILCLCILITLSPILILTFLILLRIVVHG